MKKTVVLLLSILMVVSLVACGGGGNEDKPSTNNNQNTQQETQKPTINNNDNANNLSVSEKTPDELAEEIAKGFGSVDGQTITWRVLTIDKESKKALLISSTCISEILFHETEPTEELTWETSDLRKWLNGEFYNTAFTAEQKEKILEVINPADSNSESGAHGGNDTMDKVFILSASEMMKYFKNDEDMAATLLNEDIPYWTRTPGDSTSGYVCTYADGGLYMTGNWATSTEIGVRPAIWIDLKEATQTSGTTNSPVSNDKKDFEVPVYDETKRKSDLVITSMKMSKTTYQPNEEIVVTIKWTGTPDSSAWVGIVPADIPHGDEYVNDDADLDYIYLYEHESSDFVFTYELEPGNYTIRVNEYDDGGPELGWVTFKVAGTSMNQEETNDSVTITEGIYDFEVPIEGIPDEWQKGIGEALYGMETSTDGSDFSSGYLHQFKNVSSEDYVIYKAYFDSLDYISEADGVYDCHWGQLQIGHNSEASEMTISWYVLR